MNTESHIDFDAALAICKRDPLPKRRAELWFWRGVMNRLDTLRLLAALSLIVLSPPPVEPPSQSTPDYDHFAK